MPGKSRFLVKFIVVAAVLVAVGVVIFNQLRADAVVRPVVLDAAVDSVIGSVVVHADKDLQDIKSELPGRVHWIDTRQLGEPFKAGEPIVKLDSTDLEREMADAETAYKTLVERMTIEKQNDPTVRVATQKFEIAKRRHERNEISDLELEAAQDELAAAQRAVLLADLDAKQAQTKFDNDQAARKRLLEKMTIRAPQDCILQAVNVAEGGLISAGTTVASYFANARVVIAKVGEEDIGKVKVGQKARVRLLRISGKIFEADVAAILPFAEAETQRYSVYLNVNANLNELEPFATGEAVIEVGRRENQPIIPRTALSNDRYVFVVKDGVVERRQVEVGFKALNFAEITRNLQPGELVIVEDVDLFHDGQHVRAIERK